MAKPKTKATEASVESFLNGVADVQQVDGTLKWISEQVVVEGPGTYTTVDGTFQEHLTFTYETSRVAHHNLNCLNIRYSGPDKSLAWPRELTLTDVKPLLDQWVARP